MNNQELLYKMRSLRDALNDMAENAVAESERSRQEGAWDGLDAWHGESSGLSTAASLLDGLIVEAGKA